MQSYKPCILFLYMITPVIAVYNGAAFLKAQPKIYYNGQWRDTIAKLYDGSRWTIPGGEGVLFLSLIDSDGNYVYDENGKQILVRGD